MYKKIFFEILEPRQMIRYTFKHIPAKLPKLEIGTLMAWGSGARLRGNAPGGGPGGNTPRSSLILGYLGGSPGPYFY